MATIKSKIIINVCIVLFIVLAIVGTNYFELRKMSAMQDLGATRSEQALLAKEASMCGMSLYMVIADAVLNRNLAQMDKEWNDKKAEVLKYVEETGKVAETAEEKKLCEEVTASIHQSIETYETRLLPLLRKSAENTPEIRSIDGQIEHKLATVEATMDKFVGSVVQRMKDTDAEFDRAIQRAMVVALVIGLIGILVQAGMAGWLLRQVLRPVHAMVGLLKDVAEGEGDLTKRLDDSGDDEIAEASRWFNRFIGTIQQIIGQVAGNSAQLSTASTQMHATSEHIATGAEELSAQTETVATASEEMAATSTDIARSCHHAADSARLANTAADNGTAVVQRTVTGMQQIASRVREASSEVESLGQRSEQIGQIISTIEDIADQTNLLALNAAIEAARAGDQGRGFAVVADEVRALAERTTKATREIGEMIKAIQHQTKSVVRVMEEGVHEVERGSAEAEESGLALSQIMEQINAVAMQVEQIATAAEEQTATTGEITGNIQQVTEVVQMTARGALETAEAASQVKHLSGELHTLVGRFRV